MSSKPWKGILIKKNVLAYLASRGMTITEEAYDLLEKKMYYELLNLLGIKEKWL